MKLLGRIAVFPSIPRRLERLEELAHNLWWCWNPEATALFRDLSHEVWDRVGHNPVKLLSEVDQALLDEASRNSHYTERLDRVMAQFDSYVRASDTWFARQHPQRQGELIAYFSAEFGLHESLPIYSGGLGVLSGDHCKSASDLGLPFVAVGLLYNQGYFRQRINASGVQEALYDRLTFSELPMKPAEDPEGGLVIVGVELPGRTVWAKVWQVRVGRIVVYLLDTDIPENGPEDRGLSAKLYGGDHEMRIAQEVILGIGGVRALRALGLRPTVWHLNEGHSAFSGLERLRELVEEEGHGLAEAMEAVSSAAVFTTHTPVPAGNDAFGFDLMLRTFGRFIPRLGMTSEEFLSLAAHDPHGTGPLFSMTVLALRLSKQANGVSVLHGEVSRGIWEDIWPEVPAAERPIGSVTNGIHTETWLAPEVAQLHDRWAAPQWRRDLADPESWKGLERVPDQDLWQVRNLLRGRLVEVIRHRARTRRQRLGDAPARVAAADTLLDPEVLTIGFARRFATYKRAALLFRDPERLARIVNQAGRPVQFLFAGKAHPADVPGREVIRQVMEMSRRPEFVHRVFFVEDYDMNVARHLVQGVDVWLNNPRRPLEASGTSGQKAAANGVLNASVLDGWWEEGYDGQNGWAIGQALDYPDEEAQDEADAQSLYDLLEHEIVPLFYDRDSRGVPTGWLQRSRHAMLSLTWRFSTHRMLQDYTRLFYLPAMDSGRDLGSDALARARELASWKRRIRQQWDDVRVTAALPAFGKVIVGEAVTLDARVRLGSLAPGDVAVELCHGPCLEGVPTAHRVTPMELVGQDEEGAWHYRASVAPEAGGEFGLAVRVRPQHADLMNPHETGRIRWA
ncbi:MAG: alpha-glucan family phosphorylase [Candidatus Sericytochromatia bacterium]|nr:alpha-glucan family phosphorylase [Candidatus Sericytochromatia bacterium]